MSAKYGKPLTKETTKYDPATQTYDFAVKYNYNELTIAKDKAKLTDQFGNNLDLVGGLEGVKIYPVKIDENGNEKIDETPISPSEYSIKEANNAAEGKNGFEVSFTNAITTAYVIKYSIKHNDIVDGASPVVNNVTTGGGQTANAGGTSGQQSLIKTITDSDSDAETVSWKLDINGNKYTMTDMKINDAFGTTALKLLPETLKLVDNDDKNALLVNGTDYTLVPKENGKGFDITFIGKYKTTNHKFTLTYDTRYEALENDTNKYSNTASLSWTGSDNKPHTSTDGKEYTAPVESQSNGSKSGSYNSMTKEITWTIHANYNRADLKNAKITDKIPYTNNSNNNQKFIPNSVNVYHYSVDKKGVIVKGAALKPEEFKVTEPNASNNYTVEVELLKDFTGKDASIGMDFKTSLDGLVIGGEYKNTATYTNDGKDFPLDATVQVGFGGSLVTKSGKQNGDNIDWTIGLNNSQSTISGYKIIDKPTPNQVLIESSFHIYETKVQSNGYVEADKTKALVRDVDYSLVITTDGSTGKQSFELKFLKTINKAYVLNYSSAIDANDKEGVSNEITMSGDNVTTVTQQTSKEVIVQTSSGSGDASGIRGGLTITKVDKANKPLIGATFIILDKTKKTMLRTGTTDASGTVSFGGLRAGDYVIKETESPAGFSIDPEYAVGKKVKVVVTQQNPMMTLKVVDPATLVTVSKVNEAGKGLPGATFEVLDEAGDVILPDLNVDANGKLAIEGLLEGTYTLKEVKAPAGYLLNTTPQTFDVDLDENGVMVTTNIEFKNYQGSASILKTDAKLKALPNSIFKVVNAQGDTIKTGLKSNANGIVTADGLAPGNYSFVETTATTGYGINDTPIEFTIADSSAGKPTVINAGTLVNYQGTAKLKKENDKGKSLEGAVFKLVNEQGTTVAENLTTDKNGELEVANLAPGKYTFVETKAPTGYILNEETDTFTIDQTTRSEQVLTTKATNYQGSAQLIKVDKDDQAIQGAVFKVIDSAGKSVAENLVSNAEGVVEISDLAPGDYKFVETKAAAGYVLNKAEASFTINATNTGKPETVLAGNFANYKGSAELKKVTEDNKALEGAIFKVVNDKDEDIITNLSTDKEGKVLAENLAPGTYAFVETAAPAGYVLNPTKTTFTINDSNVDKPAVVAAGEVINYKGSAELTKVDAKGNALENAEFKVIDSEGSTVVEKLTTNADGKITVANLAPGKYTFVETKAPSGYILNTEAVAFTVADSTEGKPETIVANELTNYKGSAQLTKTDADGKALENAEFKVVNSDGKTIIEKIISDENGQVVAPELEPGDYEFIETIAPTGYILNDAKTAFTISAENAGKPTVVDAGKFVNYKGGAELRKIDGNGNELAGAEFKVIDADGNTVIDKLTSNAEGKIKAADLAPGEYQFVETKAPTGYVLNTDKVSFTVEAKQSYAPKDINSGVFANYMGSAELIKVDKEGNTLEGAEFKVVNDKNETVIEKITSNEEGIVFAENLAPGTYQFVETKAPTGYIINTNPVEFTIAAAQAAIPKVVKTIELANYKGSAALTKVDVDGNALENAEFKVVDADGKTVVDNLITNSNGKIAVADLAPGDYQFVETKAPTGYVLNTDPVAFTIVDSAAGEPAAVDSNELTNYKGSAVLTKVTADGKKLENAEFKVVDKDGKTVIGKLVSNEAGEVTATELAPGTYQFIETKAPTGYILNTDPVDFTIEAEQAAMPKVVNVGEFVNYKGSAVLTKVDVDGKVLGNAEFKVIDAEGKTVIEKLVSNEAGEVTATELVPGDYQFVETKAPTGYVLNTDPVEFTIEAEQAAMPKVVNAGELANYKGSAVLTKVDVDGKVLENAEFKVIDAEGKTVIEKLVSNETGEVIASELAPGTYQFVETKAPTGYVLNTDTVEFTIEAEQAAMPKVVNAGELANYKASAVLTKVDVDGKVLENAEFKVIDAEGKTVIEKLVSNEAGEVTAPELAPGTYQFVETKAPTGYILNTEPVEFTIEAEQAAMPKVVNASEFVNYKGSAVLTKVDVDGKVLENAEFKVINAEGKTVIEKLVSN
ncbi:SpaA isopeptide-forming pilin-related protein, partial [Brochothrix thermosphacta]|uniref:SpaA isopeptide-forming pilin-related protein n=1 Tax=Brochothrix thermosphacta TaxID=2756 RepID=UPI001C500ADE